jgi:regulator of protease activity HflC (stomatin/prohibitin superfamily)
VAEGQKQAKILTSEAEKREQINLASGESEAILLRASATAAGINQLSSAIGGNNGKDAVG